MEPISCFGFFVLLSTAFAPTHACYCEHYPWSSWSGCSKTCNYGTQSRSRQIRFDDYYWKNHCDKICTNFESQACNEQACPINCQLGDFGAWSDCDPCIRKQYRVRSLLRPSQFGGQDCTEQLVDSRSCIPSKLCNLEEFDCKNKFKCDTGRCIPKNLECNGENECWDNSDERDCRRKTKVCNRVYESIPSVQLMGNGFNLLSGENRGEVLDNSFYQGKCNTIRSNDTRKSFRIPANLKSINFQVEDEDDDLASDFYDSLNNLEATNLKSGSHDHSGSHSSGIPLLFSKKTHTKVTSSSSFEEAIYASYKKNSNFIRIHKVMSVSNFTMKETDLWISEVFLKALHSLPLEYNYALYSRIFDDFGTHYFSAGSMGGIYDLLYQYSSENLKNSGLTKEESKECVRTETTRRVFFRKKKTVREKCTTNKMSVQYEGSFLQSSERSVSLVRGGRTEYAAALAWKKEGAFPESNIFTDWLESTKDNPVVVDFELAPILDLVKDFPCAVTKRRNLLRALVEYLERFDPCRCEPCPNNGRPVLSGTKCLCVCQSGTYGESCEKRAPDYKSVAIDGYWSCWSPWTACDGSLQRRRTRQCNNPAPLNGGKPCEGQQVQEEDCHFSLFPNRGALCINDDEGIKEVDGVDLESDAGCTKPALPENGFLRDEKKWYSVGEEVEIVCMSGHKLIGYQFIRCLPDRIWTQANIECQKTVCPRPSASEAVSVYPFKTEYKIGESIQLTCPSGYIVTGQKQYTCGNELSWMPPILRQLACEKELQTVSSGSCGSGQKQVGSQCVCMSPEEDCSHYSEDLCVFDAISQSYFTSSSCEYLSKKCQKDEQFHFLQSRPCQDVNLNWAIVRANLSTRSIKKEPCGHDLCRDWEKCSGTACFCLLPYQCPKDEDQQYCIQVGSSGRRSTFNLCALGAMKCGKIRAEILHSGKCLD
ncbi:complement component C6 isoform X1 [Rhinatrema bivittatum]|uniref:complement component C6 isoform X1 n=1 Tax=Rhinatrema bivittatum TaxID=194408 RepID=UPI0011278A13|nr:complement component C6 isoform X1 [Rhinatrema bivittatum]